MRRRFCKLIELLKSVVPFVIIHAHKDGAFLLNGFNFFCRAAETVIRIENFRNQCFLRELVGPHGSVHKRGAAACVFVEIAEIGRVKLSGFAVRNSDSRHAVELHRAQRSEINSGKPAVPAWVRVDAANAAESVFIAHKAH